MSLLPLLLEKLKTANRKLLKALACYAVLLAVALYELLPARTYYEQILLGLVLAVAALFIVKTFVHAQDDNVD
jgi:hypothetical protein